MKPSRPQQLLYILVYFGSNTISCFYSHLRTSLASFSLSANLNARLRKQTSNLDKVMRSCLICCDNLMRKPLCLVVQRGWFNEKFRFATLGTHNIHITSGCWHTLISGEVVIMLSAELIAVFLHRYPSVESGFTWFCALTDLRAHFHCVMLWHAGIHPRRHRPIWSHLGQRSSVYLLKIFLIYNSTIVENWVC